MGIISGVKPWANGENPPPNCLQSFDANPLHVKKILKSVG